MAGVAYNNMRLIELDAARDEQNCAIMMPTSRHRIMDVS